MRIFTAKDAKQGFGDLIDAALREPVSITKNGKPAAVLMSQRDFERFEAMEDALWALRADQAIKSAEFLGADETAKFIKEALTRADS